MMKQGIWSQEEHDRFLHAIKVYPQGPWRMIAKCIGTRSVRQVQTHAQKYHEKIQRRMRGLHKDRKTWARSEHRIDQELLDFCRRSGDFGAATSSVLQKLPLEAALAALATSPLASPDGKDEQLQPGSPSSPSAIEDIEPLCLDDAVALKPEPMELSAAELPSLSESLDFLIEYFSD